MNQFLYFHKSKSKGELWDASRKWKTKKNNFTILSYHSWEQATLQLQLPEQNLWKNMNRIKIRRYPIKVDQISYPIGFDVLHLSNTIEAECIQTTDMSNTYHTNNSGIFKEVLKDFRLDLLDKKQQISTRWADITDNE